MDPNQRGPPAPLHHWPAPLLPPFQPVQVQDTAAQTPLHPNAAHAQNVAPGVANQGQAQGPIRQAQHNVAPPPNQGGLPALRMGQGPPMNRPIAIRPLRPPNHGHVHPMVLRNRVRLNARLDEHPDDPVHPLPTIHPYPPPPPTPIPTDIRSRNAMQSLRPLEVYELRNLLDYSFTFSPPTNREPSPRP